MSWKCFFFRTALFLGWTALTLACGGASVPVPSAPPARLSTAEGEALLAEREALRASRDPGVPETPPSEPPSSAAKDPSSTLHLTLSARLLDEGARPVTGGELAWLRFGDNGVSETLRVARSDRSGAVWLALPRDELPERGPLYLAARGEGTLRQLLTLERPRWERPSIVSLDELTLRPGGTVSGRVLDPRGQPVVGAFVGLGPELAELTSQQAAMVRVWPMLGDLGIGSVPPLTLTDDEGHFRFEGVPTGRLALVAAALTAGEEPSLPDREPGVIVAPGEETIVRTLVLHAPIPGEVIRGVVLAPDGSPVGGALIALGDEAGSVQFAAGGQSTPAGRFAVLAPEGMVIRLYANDREARWTPADGGVAQGGAEVVLRFESAADSAPIR